MVGNDRSQFDNALNTALKVHLVLFWGGGGHLKALIPVHRGNKAERATAAHPQSLQLSVSL